MKFSLKTFLVLVSFAGLLIALWILNRQYHDLAGKYHRREQLIRDEYSRIAGRKISEGSLDSVLAEADRVSVSVARKIAESDNYKKQVGPLQQPEVLLQIRSGAGGGNPNRIDMAGRTSVYVDKSMKSEIVFNPSVDIDEPSQAFFRGGFIPQDKIFVVKKVEFVGVAKGDSNGHGEFKVKLGRQEIAKLYDDPKAATNVWHGEFEVSPGQEDSVMIEVANSSAGQAKFTGEFKTRK